MIGLLIIQRYVYLGRAAFNTSVCSTPSLSVVCGLGMLGWTDFRGMISLDMFRMGLRFRVSRMHVWSEGRFVDVGRFRCWVWIILGD